MDEIEEKGFTVRITRKLLKQALENSASLGKAKYTDTRVEEIYRALKTHKIGRPTRGGN